MQKIKLITLAILSLIIFSCASNKDIIYLQDLDSETKLDTISFKSIKFKIDDRLTINISSNNPDAAKPFNLYLTSFNTGGLNASGQQQQQSYIVDEKGNINFPHIGAIKVAGLTRTVLEKQLEDLIRPYLPDVKAIVQLVNFRISILGEVNKPGDYNINRDKVSVLQAIGMAGDLTIHGKRKGIKLIREVEGGVTVYEIDLKSKELINSPFYYLEQNDVLYISPNKPRVNASISSPTNSYIISATGLLITIVSLLTR